MRIPSSELKRISKSILAGLLCCALLGGCASAVPIADDDDPTGVNTVENVQETSAGDEDSYEESAATDSGYSEFEENSIQNNVLPKVPTELTFKVSYKNGSELPVSHGELFLTGDNSGSYNQFQIQILTGGDLDALTTIEDLDMTVMADIQAFAITTYIPVSDCADGLIYDYDYFASTGAISLVSYNLADYFNNLSLFETYSFDDISDLDDFVGDVYSFMPDSLTIDNVTFVLYEYAPDSYAIFSLTADVTVENTSYTLEAAGTADYLVEVEVQETCSVCGGSGICQICDGKGVNGLTGNWAGSCISCNGNKRCKYCDGTGIRSFMVMQPNR